MSPSDKKAVEDLAVELHDSGSSLIPLVDMLDDGTRTRFECFKIVAQARRDGLRVLGRLGELDVIEAWSRAVASRLCE